MITNILDYIVSYDTVRTVCGLNKEELQDSEIGLIIYQHQLGIALEDISGVYTPVAEEQNLQEIFERPLEATDKMYGYIQLYSIYVIADSLMEAVGLRAYKTMADGKSSITRFSPESAYEGARVNIKAGLDKSRLGIDVLFGNTVATLEAVKVITPDVDLVTGA